MTTTITRGRCQCGCGRQAPIATRSNKRAGVRVGQPQRFVRGHNVKAQYETSQTSHGTGAPYSRDELLDEWVFMRDTCTWKDFASRAGLTVEAWDRAWHRARAQGDQRARLGAADLAPGRAAAGRLVLPPASAARRQNTLTKWRRWWWRV